MHEATYFDSALENDPHASMFYGRLKCKYIDDLWIRFDDEFEQGTPHSSDNPVPVLDPFRKQGLSREHPFTKVLFAEALKRFRPLVDQERKQQENERGRLESVHTRKRLNLLERAAAEFMDRHVEESDATRDPDSRHADVRLRERGYNLSPPFVQLVVGQSCRFWLNILQEAFPEFSVGDTVAVQCLTDDISVSRRVVPLETHPKQEGVLRANWTVKGEKACDATGLQARIGRIEADSLLEVLESERSKYKDISELTFNKDQYTVNVGKARSIKLLAPFPSVVSSSTNVDVTISNRAFQLQGHKILEPRPELGVAICELRVTANEADRVATISAQVNGHTSTAKLQSTLPAGAPIKIAIVDEDFVNQRSFWAKGSNVLKIGARHASLRRYLGPKVDNTYPGQEEKHFRVLVAEIVADAVCGKILEKRVQEQPEAYQDMDWDRFYVEYSRLMTEFLPIAHETQLKEV